MGRVVVILGEDPDLDLAPVVDQAWKGRLELVILAIGIRLTPKQQRICDEALEAAGRGLLDVDERMVPDDAAAAALVQAGDHVTVAASKLETKRIERALGVPADEAKES